MNKFLIFLALLIVFTLSGLYIFLTQVTRTPTPLVQTPAAVPSGGSLKLIAHATFACAQSKTIEASFYKNEGINTTVEQGAPPIPNGSVTLDLGGARTFTLLQTISADGGRYANTDESFVFWNKGNGVLVLENGVEANYKGCVEVAPIDLEGRLLVPYVDPQATFSIRLPNVMSSSSDGYKVDATFSRKVNSKVTIQGVQFTIPRATATGTNLSSDSYIAVEQIPNTPSCTADLFLDTESSTSTITKSGTLYSVATTSEAAAGNRYVETIYALPDTNPCVGVHYFVHYGVFENYPDGSIKAFDIEKLKSTFDSILGTLVVNQ